MLGIYSSNSLAEDNYKMTKHRDCTPFVGLKPARGFPLPDLSLAKEECNQKLNCVGIIDICGKGTQFAYCKNDSIKTKLTFPSSRCGSILYTKV